MLASKVKYFLWLMVLVLPVSQGIARSAGFDDSIGEETARISSEIFSLPEFEPFRAIPEPLLKFIIAEKLHMYMTPSGRLIVDSEGVPISGYPHTYTYPENSYHPRFFKPFTLKGFWIPESEGDAFSLLEFEDSIPLLR